MEEKELSEEAKKAIAEWQSLQQQLQLLLLQRQQLMLALSDAQRASEEIKKTKEGEALYRSFGSVLVPKTQKELEKELSEEIELVRLRLTTLQKQEERLRARAEELRKKIEAELKLALEPAPAA